MAQTFAQQMLERYEGLLENAAGLTSVTVDGQSVAYDELERRYQFWRTRVLREQGGAPTISRIRMGGIY